MAWHAAAAFKLELHPVVPSDARVSANADMDAHLAKTMAPEAHHGQPILQARHSMLVEFLECMRAPCKMA